MRHFKLKHHPFVVSFKKPRPLRIIKKRGVFSNKLFWRLYFSVENEKNSSFAPTLYMMDFPDVLSADTVYRKMLNEAYEWQGYQVTISTVDIDKELEERFLAKV